MRRILTRALALALVTGPASAHAQQPTARGFVLGLHFTGASFSIEDSDRQGAGGGGVLVGYGVHRRLTIFAQADGARFDDVPSDVIDGGDWTLGHFDLGVRLNFAGAPRIWVPFLQASFTARAVRVSGGTYEGSPIDDASLSGGTFALGGGVDVYFTEAFALDLQLLWSGDAITRLTVDDSSVDDFDLDARSARLNLGVVWWP